MSNKLEKGFLSGQENYFLIEFQPICVGSSRRPLRVFIKCFLVESFLSVLLILFLTCVTDHSFNVYAKFSENLTFLTPLRTHTSRFRGVRNVSFSEILRMY